MTRERLIGVLTALVAVALAILRGLRRFRGAAESERLTLDGCRLLARGDWFFFRAGSALGDEAVAGEDGSDRQHHRIPLPGGVLERITDRARQCRGDLCGVGRERAAAKQGIAKAALAVGIVVAVLSIAVTVVGNLSLGK